MHITVNIYYTYIYINKEEKDYKNSDVVQQKVLLEDITSSIGMQNIMQNMDEDCSLPIIPRQMHVLPN